MPLNVDHLLRTAATLEQAIIALRQTPDSNDVLYDIGLFHKCRLLKHSVGLACARRGVAAADPKF